jgi:hypothetical protein
MDGQGSNSGKGKRYFSIPQRPDGLCGPPSLIYKGVPDGSLPGVKRLGREVITHLHLVLTSRMVELYLHSHVRFPGAVINWLNKGTTLSSFFNFNI